MRNGNAMHNTRILPLVVSVNAIRMFGLYRDSPKKKKKIKKMTKNEYLSIYLYMNSAHNTYNTYIQTYIHA